MWNLSIALHIIGMVMWVGGLLLLTRCLKLFTVPISNGPARSINADDLSFRSPILLNRMGKGFILPGLVLSVLTGLHQISVQGVKHYMSMGWFHGKVTLLLVLFVVTWLTLKDLNKLSKIVSGELQPLKKGRVIGLHAVTGVCLVLIVLLVKRVFN